MRQNLSLYAKILIVSGTLYCISAALSQERTSPAGFKDLLLDYIHEHSSTPPPQLFIQKDEITAEEPADGSSDGITYGAGDWRTYIVEPRYQLRMDQLAAGEYRVEEREDVEINSYGAARLNMKYGKTNFTSSKYRQFDQDKPVSRIITSGYNPDNEMQMHVEGHIGERLTLFIDHDSKKKDNQYYMQYRAVRDEEVIREINAGEITIKMNRSKYAVYDDTSNKGLGIDTTVRKGKLQVKAFGSVTKGETVVEYFRGNSSPGNISLGEYQYVRTTYYQLEAFKRFDNRASPPLPAEIPGTVTMTSNPANPDTYMPYSVNIDPSGFELYMDDQNPLNNYNAIQLSGIDNGYYTKMVLGSDYTINFSTGLISFTRSIPANARIFAVYTHDGGNSSMSSDPAALMPGDAKHPGGVFQNKIFVFIKYGYAIQEAAGDDRNGDGKQNLDIYEVRSYYYIGDRQILQDNFKIQIFYQNQLLTKSEIAKLGKFSVDYAKGVIGFTLREPFKTLNNSVYAENPPSTVFEKSLYSLKIDYYREARSFQLKHFNILQDSVRVKINERELPPTLYTVDYTAGFLVFTNPNNPVITPESSIEVKYEYLPFQAQSQSFVGGVRADYQFGRELNLGGTFLFTRSSGGEVIPMIGSEPTQTMVFEGDASLALNESRLKAVANAIPGVNVDSVPFELKGYAEYARSYRDINTFGKGLIDDMESSEEITGISLSDKDWMLASIPGGNNQSVRGRIYYKYYREAGNPNSLKGVAFSPYVIEYAKKPGPYNVAAGHVADSVQSVESQRSLVLDFEISGAETGISIATRKLSSQAVDFSGLQYVEIWYRVDSLSADVDIDIDLGQINEDSDGDGVLDTEDANRNGILDFDPSAGIFEDRGYSFDGNYPTRVGTGPQLNEYTMGDGVLNTEDINGNGVLDTGEYSVTLAGAILKDAPAHSFNVPVTEVSGSVWRMKRIYINRSSTAFTDNLSTLKQVEAVRLIVKGSAPVAGRIFIDSLRFVSSRWRNIKINDMPLEDPDQFSVTMVDNFNDPEYRANAFLFERSDVYTSLHGEKSEKELLREREAALQIDYNLASASGSVTRKFSKPMDVRFYKTITIWINARQSASGDRIGVRIGSSENDYYEYEFANDYGPVWREVRLNLQDGAAGGVNRTSLVGNPDLKRVTCMEFIVKSPGAGRLWINDIYASDSEMLADSAYWFEGEMRGKRPLWRTASGVPVISDIYIKYIEKGHGAQFSTVGKTNSDIKENYRELFSSVKILPNWGAQMSFTDERSDTDSLNQEVVDTKRGKTEKKTLYLESDYVSTASLVPSVKVMYKNDRYDNRRDDYVAYSGSSYRVLRKADIDIHSPTVVVKESIENFLGGRLTTSFLLDMLFKKDSIERISDVLDQNALSQVVSLREKEKRQEGNSRFTLEYQSRYFFIQPALTLGSQEIVELSGKTQLPDTSILENVRGGYHIPFVYNDYFKFVERNKKGVISAGIRNVGVLSPVMRVEMQYFENKFRDYEESERLLAKKYSRARDARSYISSSITMPFDFYKKKSTNFIRNLYFSCSRSVFLQENEIPYEGERESAFSENYGINRAFGGIGGAGLNLFGYPPWYFFAGRGNFANGRDYAYSKFNEKPTFPGGEQAPNYTNSLRLIDTFSVNTTLDLEKVMLSGSGGVNHVSERQSVNGIPQQVITLNTGMNLSFDLMRIFRFWFFRPNAPGLPHHSSSLNIGYDFNRNMLITSNIEENTHSPSAGITFKWDRSSVGVKGGLQYRHRSRKEYISFNANERDARDDVFIGNMALLPPFKEVDKGYSFSIIYETDVQWLYDFLSGFYALVAFPIFSIEYSLLFNRYDYTLTVSPEPYDQHLVTGRLTLDLHKNIQGGLVARWALERFRNRETGGISRELVSYEIGASFSLIF